MIRGRVTANREAIIELEVKDPDGLVEGIEAVNHTGFNGFLTLPSSITGSLKLPFVGNRRATLGDGSAVVLDVFLGTVLWHGQEREVLALEADGGSLVGMSLLSRNRMTMDVVDGGDVVIDELP